MTKLLTSFTCCSQVISSKDEEFRKIDVQVKESARRYGTYVSFS